MTPPLEGRTALVTGVSRRRGIGFAVACELARLGASVFTHHFAPHDAEQPWGGDDLAAVADGVRAHLVPGARHGDAAADLGDPVQADALVARAAGLTGALDVLVCNHARSGSDGPLLAMDAARLDAHWNTNARSTILLTAAFARRPAPARSDAPSPAGATTRRRPEDAPKVVWLTSGQMHGAMRGEVAYATSKAALAGVTATVAAELLDQGIILNTVNPGPVNTGYLDAETSDRPLEVLEQVAAAMPLGRFGQPADPARLIGWLVQPAGSWVVGQVLTSDGGFSL